MDRAVFLDRDNTLIANDGDLGDPAQVVLIDGVADGLARLHAAGWRLIVVTNQGGVARGKYSEDDVDAVHQQIAAMIADVNDGDGLIERFYYCPFHPEGTVGKYRREHPWRKPSPGMLEQAASDLDLDLSASWLIGDASRDIEAGRAAGCRTVLVSSDSQKRSNARADVVVTSFTAAVDAITNDTTRATNAVRDSSAHRGTFGENHEPTQRSAVAVDIKPVQAQPRAQMIAMPMPTHAGPDETTGLRRSIADLTEEMRSERQRKAEFTMLKMAAAFGQLFVILLAALGLLHLSSFESFGQWMLGALLMQMVVITVLVLDLKG